MCPVGSLAEVIALTFDVFGTVVDWRSSIIRETQKLGYAKGINIDWEAFTDSWRGLYQPQLSKVRERKMLGQSGMNYTAYLWSNYSASSESPN